MLPFLQPYFDIVLKERTWSWSLIAMLYVLAGFFVRGFFMRPLVKQSNDLEKSIKKRIKKYYFRASFWGWFFFFTPIALLIFFWRIDAPIQIKDQYVIAAAAASFLFSILLHVQAFGKASLMTLKDLSAVDKKFLEI